jgi:hypothetical protein
MRTRFDGRKGGVVLLATLVSSCGTIQSFREGKTLGLIYVDRPEVVSRERLIKDRRTEEEWLQRQLERAGDAALAIEGSRRMQVFSDVGFSAGIQAQNPLVQLSRAQTNNAIAVQLQQQEIQRLQYEEQRLLLKQRIKQLKDTQAVATPGAATPGGGSNAPQAPAPATASTPSFPSVSAPSLVDPFAAGTTSPLLPGAGDVAALADAQFSFADDFRERAEYRETIRNELLETRLDDSHDIAGNTLYRLKFGGTVLPLKDTSGRGGSAAPHQEPA